VYWDEEYFEVVAAEVAGTGSVRYVLEPWRDDHVIRTFESYNDESEARLSADYALAEKQRRNSVLTRLSAMALGHLPSPVQNRLANEMGVSPTRMTILSCVPPLVVLGVCVFVTAGAKIEQKESGIPTWVMLLAAFLAVESGMRFLVAMSQNRGMGSLLGTLVYMFVYAFSGSRKKNMPEPLQEAGDGVFFMIPPTEDVARRDSITMRGPMLSLLTPAEQVRLAKNHRYNYKDHAVALAWIILIMTILGVVSSWIQIQQGRTSAIVSLLAAGALAVEQIARLLALRRGPAGSVLGFVVRPFVRDLLE
jgi:energy-coupling factor transporter transmembrane protein EcfT